MSTGISAIVLKVAALCNLDCSYCYVYHHEDKGYLRRPKLIADPVFDRTLAAIRRYCERRSPHSMAICFHGGEPTLIGAERFDELAGRAREVLGDCLAALAIQTNATLIDEAWVETLRRHQVHVSVSLDGPAAVHDAARVDHAGRGTHARTLAGIARLRAGGVEPQVLCVINPGQSGSEVYRHFRSLGLTRMDFLLPDVSHDSRERFYPGRGPTPVADYLVPIFDAWFDEDDPGVQVRIFHELLLKLFGGMNRTDSFGNAPMGYLIVETDGAIEALDALRVCGEGIAGSGLNVLAHGFDDLALGLPLVHRAVSEGFPLAPSCQACPEREICGGGYLPHRYSRTRGFDNPSVWCADILALLGHMRARLAPYLPAAG